MTEDLKQHDADIVDDADSDNPATNAALGREVRFGISLLALLLAMLGAALYVKLGTPGLPWARHEVAAADGSEPAGEPPATEPAQASAEPEMPSAPPTPAQEETSSTKPLWENDRYAGRGEAQPPADAPLAVGEQAPAADEIPPAEMPAAPALNPFAVVDSAAQGPIDQVSAETEATPEEAIPQQGPESEAPAFAAPRMVAEERTREAEEPAEMQPETELPADAPAEGGPLVPHDAGAVQHAAGQQPTLAEPRNAPYGRPGARDRYANAPPPHSNMQGVPAEDSLRASPSVEHTPLHNPLAQRWNSPGAAPADDPYSTPLERELQNARTPGHTGQPQHTPPPAGMSELDAPAAEFAAPQDDISRHQHHPAHVPTPDGTYAVVPNDSFWTISQKVYCTGGYFKAIQKHNRKPGSNADGLEIGERILVPPVEELEQRYPQLCPKRRAVPPPGARTMPTSSQGGYGGRVYVVAEGDTLFDIARYELGKASRWSEIYELNRGQLGNDYDYLAPGTKLVLPDDVMNSTDNITARPGSQFPR
ncbi:MAG TPA: LysM peptidoglycan-binding domain-containing protein [Pirellulales bacterium]|jgi:nucleoid-associated protein YgaU